LEEIIEECFYAALEKEQRTALSDALIYLYKDDLNSSVTEDSNLLK
jgi:hypothetical protein